jgi:hypothetical protein
MKKMYCPVCFREICVTVNGFIKRHGFEKDRWTHIDSSKEYTRVDGKPCPGTGKIGLSKKEENNIEII